MGTLREGDPSVIRLVPDRDAIGLHSSTGRTAEEPAHAAHRQKQFAAFSDNAVAGVAGISTPRVGSTPTGSHVLKEADPTFPSIDCSYAPVKRAFDFVLSALFLIVFSPLMALVALAIKLTDRGPVFFKQVRVGKGGKEFVCYKFRSMCVDAESKKKMLMHLNEATGPVFKMKHDPRITRVGRFIRRTSLDEFPQFFNVLRGDMSIVGPRPPIPSEVATYTEHQRGRLAVQPGLTCLWQVNGRSNVSFDRWVELDLAYIDNMSFANDVKIVLKTIPAVLFGCGAH
jgi:exopolysaccharide biosynthesis polyprenyl glycosylphosphotransferase